MRGIFKALVALAVLAGAGWYGYQAYTGGGRLPAIVDAIGDGLPDSAEEWHGKIDYRTLDRQLAQLATRPEMAGLAVAVVEDGELRFVGTYGLAERETGVRVTPQTVFRWASVSKTATGALAATLSEEGAVDLDRPISNWQTTLRLPKGAESRVTFGQLLSQQTGLTKNAYDERLEDGQNPAVVRGQLAAAPLQCEPGTCHTYQNIAFDAASEILGAAAGQPFDAAVRERFFVPLGMKSAHYGMAGLTGAKQWARPYSNEKQRTLKESYWRVPAAAGAESNILDFAKWMQAMMGERPDVFSAATLQLAHAPRVQTDRLYGGALKAAISDAHYGLGWRSFSYGGRRFAGHSGAVDGYRATMIFEPATNTGVVALWNSNWGAPFRIPFAVFDSYHRRPDCRWLDTSAIPLPGDPAAPKTAEPEETDGPCPTR
jgi:beta-lactamase class C